jgi:DNA-binding NarL/FixJ family response regulator
MDRQYLKVLIADDHPLMLSAVRRVLDGGDDFRIVGEARTASAAIRLVENRRPDVVLLDLRMPDVSGTECIATIHERWPHVKIVVLSACDDQRSIDGALDAGASAYVIKSVEPVDIGSLLRQTVSGAIYHAMPRRAHDRPSSEPDTSPLTARERAILEAVAAGLTTDAISKKLWVSEHTIKFHLTNIYRKLGVSNRASAIRYAHEAGFVVAA